MREHHGPTFTPKFAEGNHEPESAPQSYTIKYTIELQP